VNTPSKRIPALQGWEEVNNDEFLDATFDLWRILAESARPAGHPASFPVELPERLIEIYPYPSVSSRPIRSIAVLAVVYRISGETERQFGALGSLE
jgi:hypothetical protein